MKNSVKTKILIGTSGFSYKHWSNGVFYPPGIPQRQWLEYYSEHFATVELNVSFYRLPTKKTFEGWLKRTPDDFIFALKGSRFITHVKGLTDCQESLDLFFDRVKILKKRCEVVLWQLPPGFKIDIERLANFIQLLTSYKQVRHVFEFRNKNWFCDEVYSLLREQGHSVCLADWPGLKVEIPDDFSFMYIRRHGPDQLYGSSYSEEQLKNDAKMMNTWIGMKERIYVYFNNDFGGHASRDAKTLMSMIL